ncbi:hypothetical protein [Jannaschia marina]|uniref:hypothetical protein n=1 Tax=Jannaschia marina TaxID=2741674 RepID=UPI0015CAC042|nr:hypothetical protein [Jannaschia marina]
MAEQSDFFEPKHLARNVHERFSQVYERTRLERLPKLRAADRQKNLYQNMINSLGHSELSPEKHEQIVGEINDILIRFLVIKKTIDHSVPVKPLFAKFRSLRDRLDKSVARLADPDRADIVADLRSANDALEEPSTARQVLQEVSLVEKVEAAHQYLSGVRNEIAALSDFFDYKKGLVTAGQPSLYARLFAVHALADLFEREGRTEHGAVVQQVVPKDGGKEQRLGSNQSKPRSSPRNYNPVSYAGPFLDLLKAFYWLAAPEEIAHRHFPDEERNDEGFEASIRRLAQARRKDLDLVGLLLGDVSVEDTLEFMKRADAVK